MEKKRAQDLKHKTKLQKKWIATGNAGLNVKKLHLTGNVNQNGQINPDTKSKQNPHVCGGESWCN